jgi:type IV pilus assembly protein PilM
MLKSSVQWQIRKSPGMSSQDNTHSATDRLLGILRGEEAQETSVADPVPVSDKDSATTSTAAGSVGLSEEERNALLGGVLPREPEAAQQKKPSTRRNLTIPTGAELKSYALNWLGRKQQWVGLDIGTSRIKFTQFDEKPGGLRLTDYGTQALPQIGDEPQNSDDIANLIRLTLGDERIRTSNIITAVSGPQTVIRHLLLPKVAKSELHDAILWNARKDLPFNAETAMVDYAILGEVTHQGIQKLSVLVALAEDSVIREHLAMLEKAEIIPERVVVAPLALFNAFRTIAEKQELQEGVIIEIGSANCFVLFIKDGLLQFAREITIGGQEIIDHIAGSHDVGTGVHKFSRKEAEEILKEIGVPDPTSYQETRFGVTTTQLEPIILPPVDRMVAQIQRTMDYFRSKFSTVEPDAIWLSGGVAAIPGFQEYLAETLGKQVNLLDPCEDAALLPKLAEDADFQKSKPAFAVAYGIASTGSKGLNLLPADLKAIPKQAMAAKLMKTGAAMVGLLLCVLTWATWGRGAEDEMRLLQIQQQLETLQPAVRQVMTLQQQKSALTSNYQALQASIAGIGQTHDVIGVLQMLSNMIPEYMRINEIVIGEGGGNQTLIRGTLLESGSQYQVLLMHFGVQLENTKLFSNVAPFRQFPLEGGAGIDFEFACTF